MTSQGTRVFSNLKKLEKCLLNVYSLEKCLLFGEMSTQVLYLFLIVKVDFTILISLRPPVSTSLPSPLAFKAMR